MVACNFGIGIAHLGPLVVELLLLPGLAAYVERLQVPVISVATSCMLIACVPYSLY